MIKKNTLILAAAAVFLVATTAVASVYLTKEHTAAPKAAVSAKATPQKVVWDKQQPAPVQQKAACNDGNIVGKALGGVGGGVAGSMIGKGHGKTAATIGGTLGGAYVGGEVLPTHNVTCQ